LARQQSVEHAAFSPDRSRVATESEDHAIHLWDCATGRHHASVLHHRGVVLYAAFSPDGRLLVTASDDGAVRVWDLTTIDPIAVSMKVGRDIQRVAFLDGNHVFSISKGGGANAWDLTPNRQPVAELVSLARVLSEHRITTEGTLIPLDAGNLRSAWEHLTASRK
jgi:hypothetical protein